MFMQKLVRSHLSMEIKENGISKERIKIII